MIHLIYVSSATKNMSEAELISLLQECRRFNEAHDITGMLLYAGGNFIQVIEGKEKQVLALYQSIVKDPRNSGNILIEIKSIVKRAFSDWTMGFRHLTPKDAKHLKGYSDFLTLDMQPLKFVNHKKEVLQMLSQFKTDNAA